MSLIKKLVVSLSLSAISCIAMAQVPYDKIEVGTVLQKAGIDIGSFVKPLPLPQGEWLVMSKRADDVVLRNNRGEITKTIPRVVLTLKNAKPADSAIYAMVMSFTPEPAHVNWGNRNCESKNPKLLADDFGTKADGLVYTCSYLAQHSNYKEKIAKGPESTNEWWKKNLSVLAEYSAEAPDTAVMVDLFANQYRGLNVIFTFVVRRDGDVFADAGYADHIKNWVHATGLELQKVVDNSEAVLPLPTAYTAPAAK